MSRTITSILLVLCSVAASEIVEECLAGSDEKCLDTSSLLQAQVDMHDGDKEVDPPPFDEMSAWAGGKPAEAREGVHRTELITMLYGSATNPIENFQNADDCGKNFPWSITETQLVQVVDPVIQKAERPLVFMEVGVLYGKTSIKFAERLMAKASDKVDFQNSVVISVDTWLGDMALWNSDPWKKVVQTQGGTPRDYACFVGNVRASPAKDYIVPLRLPSTTAARLLYQKGVRADLIYVDGSHDYQDVLDDLQRFSRLLTTCGKMFGDDFHIENVKQAVLKFSKDKGFKLQEIEMRQAKSKKQISWVLTNAGATC